MGYMGLPEVEPSPTLDILVDNFIDRTEIETREVLQPLSYHNEKLSRFIDAYDRGNRDAFRSAAAFSYRTLEETIGENKMPNVSMSTIREQREEAQHNGYYKNLLHRLEDENTGFHDYLLTYADQQAGVEPAFVVSTGLMIYRILELEHDNASASQAAENRGVRERIERLEDEMWAAADSGNYEEAAQKRNEKNRLVRRHGLTDDYEIVEG